MKQPVQLFPTTLGSYSDVYASREKTAYRVGRPDGSPMTCFNLSEREAKEMLSHLPEELLQHVKDHYDLVPSAVLKELEEELADGMMSKNQYEDIVDTDVTDESIVSELEEGVPLEEMTRDQLRDVCKTLEITGYSKLSKDELIAAIYKHAEESEEE